MNDWIVGDRLDRLVVGLPIHEIDGARPFAALEGNATRAYGLAHHFSVQGWRTGLLVEQGCKVTNKHLLPGGLILVPADHLESAAAAADTVVLCSTNLRTLRARRPGAFRLHHPRKWLAMCFDQNGDDDLTPAVTGAIGASFNNYIQAQSWRTRFPGMPVHIVPYGVEDVPVRPTTPQAPGGDVAVWIGALRMPIVLKRIYQFAEANPECEVRIVAGKIYDQRLPDDQSGSPGQPYINALEDSAAVARFPKISLLWCGRQPPGNVRYLGACPGENDRLLGEATAALAFSRREDQQHDDSKILDALARGTPVICDNGQPACRFLSEHSHGSVLDFNHMTRDDLRAAWLFCKKQSTPERRAAIARWTVEKFGWHAVAAQLSEAIELAKDAARDAARQRMEAELQAWPELRRYAGHAYYDASALNLPRFERHHVMEVVERARRLHPNARRLLLSDRPWILPPDSATPVASIEQVAAVEGAKVCICAFDSDERLAVTLAGLHQIPDTIYLMPRVFIPTARYFHRNDTARGVLRAEAALPEPKFSLADYENLIQALESTRNVPGDFVEVGVYRGRSAHCVLSYFKAAGWRRRAWFMDVFSGFTYAEAAASKDACWNGSHTDSPEEHVRTWLSEFPDAYVLRHNIITDPLPAGLQTIAVANIDVHLYEAVAAALKRLSPLTVPGSILVLEDQGHTPPLGGAWLAVHEFLGSTLAEPFTPIHLASGQMFLVRNQP